jgi:hypothetical protein
VGGSPPRIRLSPSSRRTFCGSSRVLAALDADKAEKDGGDGLIDILVPFPEVSRAKGTNSGTRKSAKMLVFKFSI